MMAATKYGRVHTERVLMLVLQCAEMLAALSLVADDPAFLNNTRYCVRWSGRCSASYAGLSSVGTFYWALFPVSIKKTTIITMSWWKN